MRLVLFVRPVFTLARPVLEPLLLVLLALQQQTELLSKIVPVSTGFMKLVLNVQLVPTLVQLVKIQIKLVKLVKLQHLEHQ